MTPVELVIIALSGWFVGIALLFLVVLTTPLVDLLDRRKDDVPRRAVLEYYPKHLRHYIDWPAVPQAAALVGSVFAGAATILAILTVGLLEVLA